MRRWRSNGNFTTFNVVAYYKISITQCNIDYNEGYSRGKFNAWRKFEEMMGDRYKCAQLVCYPGTLNGLETR